MNLSVLIESASRFVLVLDKHRAGAAFLLALCLVLLGGLALVKLS